MAAKRWQCQVCGYLHEGDEPPEACPVCGVGADLFEPYAAPTVAPPVAAAKLWRCTICHLVAEGDTPPQKCPLCGADASQFVPYAAPPEAVAAQTERERIVVVGGGVAGLMAAEAARRHAPQATVKLVCKEPDAPYHRLNLTRLLAGEIGEPELALHPAEWYAEQRIELVFGDVARIERDEHAVALRDGTRLGFDRLVLTSGAHPFIPPIPGTAREGVYALRTKAQASSILARVRPGTPCVCVGGGLLGLEAAGALRSRGARVTVLESFEWLLPRQLARPGAELLQRRIEALGITVRLQARAAEILGDEDVRAVKLADDTELAAELVVLAAGVRPNSHLARQCGLAVRSGVVVDDEMRTSDPAIFAAGDVAEHRGVVYGLWPSALAQGRTAGTNAAGGQAEFRGIPPATQLKVLGIPVFSIGQFQATDGSFRVLEYAAPDVHRRLVCHDGVVVGANLIGDTSLAGRVRDAIDATVPLAELGDLLTHFAS
jgi:nitrite reductase (NADH) large subunit